MSSAQIQKLRVPLTTEHADELFNEHDSNKDGVLSKEELTRRSQAANPKHVSDDTTGSITAASNVVATRKAPPARGPKKQSEVPELRVGREELKQIFKEHDVDGDGRLSISELTRAFAFLGSIIPLYKAHYGRGFADDDGDGFITEDELNKLVDYAHKTYGKT